MAEHEPCTGATDDWYTPPEIFDALGLTFDLDPCSPGPEHWVPARKIYTKTDDGLNQPWGGLVFMNPPFGGRFGQVPWLERFLHHSNGVAIVRAYTSSSWWHEFMPRAHGLLFPRGKTKFIRPDGSVGGSPGHGIVLVGMGSVACDALIKSQLGMFWNLKGHRGASGCKNWAGECQVHCGQDYCAFPPSPQSAPRVSGSLPSGESDRSVKLGSSGADTALPPSERGSQ